MVHGGELDEAVLDRNWRLALRVAVASAGLAAALAAALYVFVGVNSSLLVAVAGAAALLIGSRLPPASPRSSLRRLRQLV